MGDYKRRLKKYSRLPAAIAWTAEIAGQNAGVAGNSEIAEFSVRDCHGGCRPRLPADLAEYRYCRPRMGDCVARFKRLPVGIAGTADFAGIAENEVFPLIGECCPRLPGLPILPRLQAENRRLHAEIEKIAGTAQIADIGKIVDLGKGAEIA